MLKSSYPSNRPITLFIPGLEGGGAQRVFVNLANTLVCITKHPVHLVILRDGGVFQNDLDCRVNLINLGTGRVSRSVPALVRYMRTHRPTVFASTMNYSNVVAIVAWRLAGRPCRLVVREANVVREDDRLLRMLMRWLYPQVDCVIALSPEVASSILRAGIRVANKLVEIGNPCTFSAHDNVAMQPDCLPRPTARFVCAVGRLSYQKGFDILLSAFALLSDENLHLVILGEGPLRAELEEQSRVLGIQQRVHLPGFVKCPVDILGQADLFVLSSRWEGFPNVLLDALSVGVPIVAADCAGAPRSILEDGRHGVLVEPENIAALAQAIEMALVAPVGTPESRRARAEDFSAERITRKYLAEAFLVST